MNETVIVNKRIVKIKPGVKLFLALLPFLLMYFIFCYKPLWGWVYAFYRYKNGAKLADMKFVGFDNFLRVFGNSAVRKQFMGALWNTVIMSTMGTLTSFAPVLFAILLNEIKNPRYKKLLQTFTTIPHFTGWVIVFAIAFQLFSSEGLVNSALMFLGMIDNPINFMANSTHARLDMILWDLWKGIGWGSIVYLAALGSIDTELYDAAAVDGAGRFRKIRHITIPGLLPTYVTLLIMGIGSFLSTGMEKFMLFSNSFNLKKLEVLDLYVYNLAFKNKDFSLSIAVGIFKSVVGLLLLFISNWISGKVREEKVF